MIRLPFGWRLTIQLFHAPKILEDHWVDSYGEVAILITQLEQKYKGQKVYIRTQYMIQNNQDRIVVFAEDDSDAQ